jgi:15-cis-phytoene synthase
VIPSVGEAYRICREIARREAKNFYYSFLALPETKRNAICAVYAFMRHADDLSDDESLSLEQRRHNLESWVSAWHRAEAGEPTEDPVFVALADAQRRFAISSTLLDQLVQGTSMDLHTTKREQQYDTYESFEELYQYCYYVASVVGLVCIRIFGYDDPRAEKLAEETGIAFQLTNILRDVREDAERARIYLPLEDLREAGVSVEELAALKSGQQLAPKQRALLEKEAMQAERYYQSGQALLPLISADARPALWVLIEIYHRLLRRIEAQQYDVFSARVSVPTRTKLWILFRGMAGVLWNRLRGAV